VRPVGAPVEGDDPPSLGDDHGKVARLLGGAVAGQVPQARLFGGKCRVRGELDVGIVNVGDVRRDYEGAVHLGQLVKAHRGELGLDLYAAGDQTQPLELARVGDDDEGPVVGPDDVVYGVS
jgi:hypothetical protein